jgi:hypothetical protein
MKPFNYWNVKVFKIKEQLQKDPNAKALGSAHK